MGSVLALVAAALAASVACLFGALFHDRACGMLPHKLLDQALGFIPQPLASLALVSVPVCSAAWTAKRSTGSPLVRCLWAATLAGAILGLMSSMPPGLYVESITDVDISSKANRSRVEL